MIYKALSVRLSLMVVCEIALLLLVSLVVMFYFSRQTLKQEAMHNAEHTLEGTVQHIDNVLLSVEQSAGNIYWDVLSHLQEPDRMYTYCRRLIESNRYIGSCTIAFKPGYFSGYKGFLACAHKDSNGVIADERDNQQKVLDNTQYTEQEWYTIPMETGHAIWTNPQKQAIVGNEVVTTFCLPIYDRSGECVGVMAADLSVGLLSRIIRTAKPSDNGYTVLISRNGSFIVHPNLEKLKHQIAASAAEGAGSDVTDVSGVKILVMKGMDVNLLASYQKDFVGWQTSGVCNFTEGECTGASFSLALNMAKVETGLQVATINSAQELHGVQIGVINVAHECPWGLQIGVINIILDNKVKILPIVNGYFGGSEE